MQKNMALENLKHNLEIESALVKEIFLLSNRYHLVANKAEMSTEKKILMSSFNSLIVQARIINDSIPKLLEAISPYKPLKTENETESSLVKLSFPGYIEKTASITIAKKDREKFLKELNLSKDTLKKLKKGMLIKDEEFVDFKKPNPYVVSANRVFKDFSTKLIEKGYFPGLSMSLRKANMPFLLISYLSIIFFTTLLSIFAASLIFIFIAFFKISLSSPFLKIAEISAIGILKNLLICMIIPPLTFVVVYFYPAIERRSIEKLINREVPFVVIHMSAIAGSGIEPTQIFKIVALSKEYKYTRVEFKKIINQVNIYGYDLVTALKNTARETSSEKLSELLNGMVSSISSGTSLTEFLDKRAETLLFEYRLEKEKQTKTAETFMDIYVSIVIAAPMVMTLLMVLMGMGSMGFSMSITSLTIIIVTSISMLNLLFMLFLHMREE